MILKLTKGTTTPVLLTVTGVVRDVPSTNPRYGPQHKLVGHTPTDPDACIFLSPETAVRQLARVGLTLDTVPGHTIAISRPGDYIDFNPASGAPVAAPVAAPAAAPAPASNAKQAFTTGPAILGLDTPAAPVAEPSKDERLKAMFALYDKCFDHAAVTSKRLKAVDIATTHEGIAAQTATLFIAAKERGLA